MHYMRVLLDIILLDIVVQLFIRVLQFLSDKFSNLDYKLTISTATEINDVIYRILVAKTENDQIVNKYLMLGRWSMNFELKGSK